MLPILLLLTLSPGPFHEPSPQAYREQARCAACHLDPEAPALPSPVLEGVATRRPAEFLRRFLDDPAGVRPGTVMPDVVTGEGAERSEAVEALVHFLASPEQGGQRADEAQRTVDATEIERGRRLFHYLGCAACHEPFEDAESLETPIWEFADLGTVDGPRPVDARSPLGDARRDWTAAGLAEFLRDPVRYHPDGRMPSLALSADEAYDLVTYLRFESAVADGLAWERTPGLGFEYFEGDFPQRGPDWNALEPVASGMVPSLDQLPPYVDDGFGFRLRGMVAIPERGRWTLSLESDDGSMLWLDGELLIDNGGAHGAHRIEQERFLEAGLHAIEVTWYELGGDEVFEVTWAGPGTPEGPIPAEAFERWTVDVGPPPDLAPLAVDPTLAATGRAHFAELGCANCHPGVGVEPALSAAALDAPPPAAPAERLADHIERLQCTACHARDGRGGPTDETRGDRRGLFTAAIEVDLGDHGRYPPTLEGAGAKLTTDWMERILAGGERARPYVRTRMPSYGADNVAELPALFEAVDLGAPAPAVATTLEAAEIGRDLAAPKGLGCVQCHYYAGNEPPGGPALDLADAANRVRPAWFRKMLLDPSSVDMQSRMPTLWQEGRSPVRDVLDGDPERQTDAVWAWLERGNSLPLPEGLLVPDLEFEVEIGDRPRLVGVFMEGVSPRTLAVGHPEGLHVAFDLQASRLAKAWRGRFFNAKGTWFARAGQLERPGSNDVLELPAGPTFARLDASDAPWPDARDTLRPLGRRFDEEGRPVFRYALLPGDRDDGVEISERVVPVLHDDGQRFLRELTLTGAAPPWDDLWLRAAVGDVARVEVIEGPAAVAVEGPEGPELRVPVQFDNGQARIVLEVSW